MDELHHPDHPDTVDVPGRPGRVRRRALVAASAVALALVIVVALVVTGSGGDSEDDTRTAAPPDPTTEASPDNTDATGTIATPTTEVETGLTTPAGPSATNGLAPFLAAAADLDAQLHDAAAAINGAGPPWAEVPESVAHAVTDAAFVPVGRTIPAGLPPDLLQATILVYSDLVSRRAAMRGFETAGPVVRPPEELLGELANGHAAAQRFDSDLAALRSLAAASPPLRAIPAEDRANAEVLLLVSYTAGSNLGCASAGGKILIELPEIVWSEEDLPDWMQPEWQQHGTIGPIDFSASFLDDGTWTVRIWAC